MDFVVVDVETTGWLPEQAMIIEIGAVRICGGQVTGGGRHLAYTS